jgi:Rrf2 family protein
MRLSRESRYAIEALVVLAGAEGGTSMEARQIATAANLPMAYLHKIMASLVGAGVVGSKRGKGYTLARSPREITMHDVLSAIEGPEVFGGRCIFWREECSDAEPCELHFRWMEWRPRFEAAMAATTLEEIRAADPRDLAPDPRI